MRYSILLLILISALSVLTVKAQVFYGGVFGGVNMSQIDGDMLLGFDKANVSFGGYVGRNAHHKIDALLELKYIGKGRVRFADVESGDDNYFRVDLHYLEMPIYARIPVHETLQLFLEPGLAVSYLFSQKFFDGYGELSSDQVGKVFKESEISAFVGVNYKRKEHWLFRVRLQSSLLPIGKDENWTASSLDPSLIDYRNYNRNVEFIVGYEF